jgi:hypothetical protein
LRLLAEGGGEEGVYFPYSQCPNLVSGGNSFQCRTKEALSWTELVLQRLKSDVLTNFEAWKATIKIKQIFCSATESMIGVNDLTSNVSRIVPSFFL